MTKWLLRIALVVVALFNVFMLTFAISNETVHSNKCHRAGGVYVLTWLQGFKCIKVNGVIVVNE